MKILENVATGTQTVLFSDSGRYVLRCSAGSALIKLDIDQSVFPAIGTLYHILSAGKGVTINTSENDKILIEASSNGTTVTGGPQVVRDLPLPAEPNE